MINLIIIKKYYIYKDVKFPKFKFLIIINSTKNTNIVIIYCKIHIKIKDLLFFKFNIILLFIYWNSIFANLFNSVGAIIYC